MSKAETGSFFSELFTTALYKRNQGRLARQLTAAGLGAVVLIGAYVLSQGPLNAASQPVKVGVPTLIVVLAGWIIFRLINYPVFAEFLISVEGEMNKVSWASKQEVYRATVVVLGTMLFLAAVLFAYDSFWYWVLSWAGILRT